MRNRRRYIPEVNLTPLLDILFSVLFIVMIAGAKGAQSNQDKNEALEVENAQLTSELELSRQELESYRLYSAEAVIVTVTNSKIGDDFYLYIYSGSAQTELDKIKLASDRKEYIKTRIDDLISELVVQNVNKPVYIVFYLDKQSIHRDEYNAVFNAFNELQQDNKEVFFKVVREE